MVLLKSIAPAVFLALVCHLHAGETVLLDFYADWCGPCRSMVPVVERLISEGHAVRRINVDQQRQLAARFRVTALPCFVMLVDGQEVDRQVGAVGYERLAQMVGRAGGRQVKLPRPGALVGGPAAGPAIAAARSPRQGPAPAEVPLGGARQAPPPVDSAGPQRATVRIRVDDPSGQSYGTGTIIDARDGKALILTCGHLFRDAKREGKIVVDLFDDNGPRSVPGQLISYDLDRDLGLLAINAATPITVAKVAPKNVRLVPGQRVLNVGCDHGQDPTVQQTRITAIDRYDGLPNVEVAGMPVEGRSGGGLFDQQGRLIGVCFAADSQDNEGLYSGLASIHAELERLGLGYVAAETELPAAAGPATPAALAKQMPMPRAVPLPAPAAVAQAGGPTAVETAVAALGNLKPSERASLQEIGRRSQGGEVICIIRPANPQAASEIIVLKDVSEALVASLTQQKRAGGRRLTSMEVPPRGPAGDAVSRQLERSDAQGWEGARMAAPLRQAYRTTSQAN